MEAYKDTWTDNASILMSNKKIAYDNLEECHANLLSFLMAVVICFKLLEGVFTFLNFCPGKRYQAFYQTSIFQVILMNRSYCQKLSSPFILEIFF